MSARPNQEERDTGAEPLTQFGRMCAALGIQIIPASSPQAKGRIERNHGTHQDRLVKKLRRQRHRRRRRRRMRFSRRTYWADHNRRFAQAPASADDFHVAVPRGVRLDTVFRLEEKRTVSNDWVVRYDNRLLQLERQSGQAAGAQHGAGLRGRRRPARDSLSRSRDALDRDHGRSHSRSVTPAPAQVRPARPRAVRLKPRRVARSSVAPQRRAVRIDQQLAADRRAVQRR